MIAFGPIPSRRLGRSLGVNYIPLRSALPGPARTGAWSRLMAQGLLVETEYRGQKFYMGRDSRRKGHYPPGHHQAHTAQKGDVQEQQQRQDEALPGR